MIIITIIITTIIIIITTRGQHSLMPGSRSNPTQKAQNCPRIPGPTNPLSPFLLEENTDGQRDPWILNVGSLLLALPAPCGLILPIVPEPQSALRCPPGCPSMAELTHFSGGWGHRKRPTHSSGLSEHNRHCLRLRCSACALMSGSVTLRKAGYPDKGAAFLLPKELISISPYTPDHIEL